MSIYPGNLLTATAASVAGSPTPSRTWQWLRNGTAIVGATSDTYTLTDDDIGASVAVRQIESNVAGQRTATSAVVSVSSFTPTQLFASGEAGDWFDPSDLSRMFTDTTGATPVTADGQTVALMLGQRRGANVELVTNGTFDTDISGWTQIGGGSHAWESSGAIACTDVAGADCNSQTSITTVVGRVYKITWEVKSGTGGWLVRVRNSGDYSSGYIVGTGNYSAYFIASTVSNTVNLLSADTDQTIVFDNISVKEVALTALTQSDAAKRPLYKTSGGLHWLQFDGSDDFLPFPDPSFMVGVKYTVAGAYSARTNSGGSDFLLGGTTAAGNSNLQFGWASGTAFGLRQFANDLDGAETYSSAVRVGVGINGAAGKRVRVNGTQIASNSNTDNLSAWGGGAIGRYVSSFYDINVYLLVMRAAETVPADITPLEVFLAQKGGVTL
jgi:hypothetical protein